MKLPKTGIKMAKIMIPPFVEKMGNRIISYIMNISEDDAENISKQDIKLTKSQKDTLEAFITLCKDIRVKYVDHENIAPYMFYDLFSSFSNGEHIFNVWRKKNGGNVVTHEPCGAEKLLSILNRIIYKIYPLFLIHTNGWNWPSSMILSSMSKPVWQFPELRSLLGAFLEDDSISSMFSCKKDFMETKGWYMSSEGHGGVIHLIDLP
ncbi:hypothetical protein VU08_04410 [Desulfobulbus sp. F5]|nr:hypothetical protein [Desulfobulbus sp. F5]